MTTAVMATLSESGKTLGSAFHSLHDRDQVYTRRWLEGGPFRRGAISRIMHHDYADADELIQDATATLQPTAMDFATILAVVMQIAALFGGLKPPKP